MLNEMLMNVCFVSKAILQVFLLYFYSLISVFFFLHNRLKLKQLWDIIALFSTVCN